jgi:hypothetical protein
MRPLPVPMSSTRRAWSTGAQAQQNAVRTDLHGAAVVIDVKLLERETVVAPHSALSCACPRKMAGDYSG